MDRAIGRSVLRRGRSRLVGPTALIIALACPAMTAADGGSAIPGASPLAESRLAVERGGFAEGGTVMDFTLDLVTEIDGAVVNRLNLSQSDLSIPLENQVLVLSSQAEFPTGFTLTSDFSGNGLNQLIMNSRNSLTLRQLVDLNIDLDLDINAPRAAALDALRGVHTLMLP